MSNNAFPPLNLNTWQATRDTIHTYTKLLGKIRANLVEPLPNWWHISLHVGKTGFTTSAMPIPHSNETCTLTLNLREHTLDVASSIAPTQSISLLNQSPHALYTWTLEKLQALKLSPDIDASLFASQEGLSYYPPHAETGFTVYAAVNEVFGQFKDSLSGEVSPVNVWPHHFDMDVVWFSGREAQVDEGEEGGKEQIGFGFSSGDEGIPQAYFYANPWPFPSALVDTPLPGKASWHTESWQGGLLLYGAVSASPNPSQTLLDFLQTVYGRASALMK